MLAGGDLSRVVEPTKTLYPSPGPSTIPSYFLLVHSIHSHLFFVASFVCHGLSTRQGKKARAVIVASEAVPCTQRSVHHPPKLMRLSSYLSVGLRARCQALVWQQHDLWRRLSRVWSWGGWRGALSVAFARC